MKITCCQAQLSLHVQPPALCTWGLVYRATPGTHATECYLAIGLVPDEVHAPGCNMIWVKQVPGVLLYLV